MATKEELENLLTEARQKLKEQDEVLRQLTAPPLHYSPVISVSKTHITVGGGGGQMKLLRPKVGDPKPGDFALVNAMTKGIVDFETPCFAGQTHIIKRIVDELYVEISNPLSGESKMVLYGVPLEEGDQVLLDSTSSVVIRSFGKPAATTKPYAESPVTWDDVGGLDNLKTWFKETLESPFEHKELYSFYNLSPPKGVLMSGPPGCGKTLIAKAVAHSLNNSLGGGFISLKGPEVLAPLVGVAEQTIREIFRQAREFKAANGFPAIIFVDEAEAILNRRGSGVSSDVDRTIVPAFLAEMDGMEDSGAIVLLATNRPEMLDPAVVREGRIDKKVRIPRPNRQSAQHIFSIHISKVPVESTHTPGELAERAADFTFLDKHVLADVHYQDGEVKPFCFRDILSGAMIATTVQQAAQLSFARDMKAKKPRGLTWDMLELSIKMIRNQNCHVDHVEDIKNFHDAAVQKVIKCIYEEAMA